MSQVRLYPVLAAGVLLCGSALAPSTGRLSASPAAAMRASATPDLSTATRGGRTWGDTIDVPSTPLEVAAVEFARAFSSGSETALGALLAPEGIHLQISGAGRAGLSSRQALASLMEFLRAYDRSKTLVSRAAPLDGSPDRGFAEVLWLAHAVGTSDEINLTLFLGLQEGDQGEWKIDEVRILR